MSSRSRSLRGGNTAAAGFRILTTRPMSEPQGNFITRVLKFKKKKQNKTTQSVLIQYKVGRQHAVYSECPRVHLSCRQIRSKHNPSRAGAFTLSLTHTQTQGRIKRNKPLQIYSRLPFPQTLRPLPSIELPRIFHTQLHNLSHLSYSTQFSLSLGIDCPYNHLLTSYFTLASQTRFRCCGTQTHSSNHPTDHPPILFSFSSSHRAQRQCIHTQTHMYKMHAQVDFFCQSQKLKPNL